MKVKLVDGVDFTELEDTGILLDMNKDLFYAVDEIGSIILDAIINLTSLELVLKELQKQFLEEVGLEKMLKDYIYDLNKLGLLEIEEPMLFKNEIAELEG